MSDPKTALVLSAGGMFGAYQAGVWKALSRNLAIDLVTGASVGALNGWLIAGGCPAERLEREWLDPAAGSALKILPGRGGWNRIRSGYFDPAPLRAMAERLHRECTPRMPFGLALVRLPDFKTVLIRHPDIRPVHLQATCSIPLVLPPVSIAERRYVDGGLIEKLPLRAALEMGATRIVAIDSLPEVGPRFVRLGLRAFRLLRVGTPPAVPAGIALTVISPSEPLGSIDDAVKWKRENVERWIELGFRDGLRALSLERNRAA